MNIRYLLFSSVAIAVASPVAAQSAEGSDTGADATAVSDIVVTARKRSETLISTPVVVTAIGEAQLQQRGIVNVDSIARVVPQLMIGPSQGARCRAASWSFAASPDPTRRRWPIRRSRSTQRLPPAVDREERRPLGRQPL